MVEIVFISQKDDDNNCAELLGGMYRCFDAVLLCFVIFCRYAVIPKVLGLTQSKSNLCIFSRNSDKDKPEIILICYVENFCIVVKPEHVDKKKKKILKEFGIIEYGQLIELLVVQYK